MSCARGRDWLHDDLRKLLARGFRPTGASHEGTRPVTPFAAVEHVLAWHHLGAVSSRQVVAFADGLIMGLGQGEVAPEWLIDLSLLGPRRFGQMGERDFPGPRTLSFIEGFRALVESIDPEDEVSVASFAWWCARSAMAEDLELTEVQIGYEIEHAMSFGNAGAALDIARRAILEYKPTCRDMRDLWLAMRLSWSLLPQRHRAG